MDEYLESMREEMEAAASGLERELTTLRTGRASPKLLEGVQILVQSYGASMPLNQLATIQAPDPRLLVVTPWDKSTLADVERGLVSSNLGLNPSSDGQVVRVPVPPLTQDRRQELVKRLRRMGEDTKVRMRHVRREYNELIKTSEKDGDITEDDSRGYLKQIQDTTNGYVEKVDQRLSEKEAEVLEI